ncbi:MAG: hypothetical protein CMO80_04655 [Verrucomicrobiales bacterium]|nr:hypothetical protein [Verrucomicrobiales bacterium]|tara:strand:+ start:1251 stop:2327 length:1077 start_codon:yes stop_codon:yes gene_type:complete
MTMRKILFLFLSCITCAAHAQKSTSPEEAWQAVIEAMRPPARPADTKGRLMTASEMQAFRRLQAVTSAHAADLARDFAKKFPTHEKAATARLQTQRLLSRAVLGGLHNRADELEAVEKEIIARHSLTDDQRYAMRKGAVERKAMIAQAKNGGDAMLAAYEQGVRVLQKEFPNRPENLLMLFSVASRSSGRKAKELAAEVAKYSPSPQLRDSTLALLKQMERIDAPLRLKFKDLNGDEIDTAKLKGKVILLDFWATWCGPCVVELPKLKGLHAKYHDEGLEILGISADVDKKALVAMVNYKKIPWPQFFDEENRVNRIKQELGVNELPAQWLVDRKGKLRSTNAMVNREELIRKLLAEQ